MSQSYDVAVIGGGIIGLAIAQTLAQSQRVSSLIVLEKEPHLAAHQTGHNSGVIHSGLYYKPGSRKAQLCVTGRQALYQFCQEQQVPYEQCGKVVVATCAEELPALERLAQRGLANGLLGIRWLQAAELPEYEPYVQGIAGLYVPETGIVDFWQVAQAYARVVCEHGGVIQTSTMVTGCREDAHGLWLTTTRGDVRCRLVVNCAGLYADRVAQLCGVSPKVRIIPFRGEYYTLIKARCSLVRNLIYPVPDPRFPFLGVHFTRMIGGGVEAGPNAVLAFKREGYRHWDVSLRDILDIVLYHGFWRLSRRHWRMGVGEMYRSLSKRAFVRELQRLIPDVSQADVQRGGAGVRAQALGRDGALVDDFAIMQVGRMVHVLNTPSPAATASLSIGQYVATLVVGDR